MKQTQAPKHSLCPLFEKAFGILGKKWNGLIIDVLLENGEQRFTALKQSIPDLSDRVLAERLKELEAEGILVKNHRCTQCEHTEYTLTEKGRALQKAMTQIKDWAHVWLKEQ